MEKVKYIEINVAKSQMKIRRMGKVIKKRQELEVVKNKMQEWEDGKS